jgi:hypothetical protein
MEASSGTECIQVEGCLLCSNQTHANPTILMSMPNLTPHPRRYSHDAKDLDELCILQYTSSLGFSRSY